MQLHPFYLLGLTDKGSDYIGWLSKNAGTLMDMHMLPASFHKAGSDGVCVTLVVTELPSRSWYRSYNCPKDYRVSVWYHH
jgi:hypothetical protein